MKSEKSILLAFILNLLFSVFEFFGGIFTNSIAILSDSLHDMGDALSIGISFFLERKSKKHPNETYTYGYARYSVIGGAISYLILLLGSLTVIYSATMRIIHPAQIDHNGMLIFAAVGVCVNLLAAFFTGKGDSLNQKAVTLHLFEDVLGWIVTLIGALVIKFTDLYIIDPILSLGVALFILVCAVKNLKKVLDILLEKAPQGVNEFELKEIVRDIEGITDVHHVHVWSIDDMNNCATMHVVTNADSTEIKQALRKKLSEHGIRHVTLELEDSYEVCNEKHCRVDFEATAHHHHHHHHH